MRIGRFLPMNAIYRWYKLTGWKPERGMPFVLPVQYQRSITAPVTIRYGEVCEDILNGASEQCQPDNQQSIRPQMSLEFL